MRIFRHCIFFIFFLLTINASNSATTAISQQTPKRIALLFGNWDYDLDGQYTNTTKPNYVPDLRMPCKDVDLIKKPLIDADFEVMDECNLNQAKLEILLNKFKSKVRNLPKGSLIFVYYAGHGIARHGYTFAIPVEFKWNKENLNKQNANSQIIFFQSNAIDVRDIFAALPKDFDIKVVIALDNCRENPLTEEIGYNEAVSLRPPPNALIQYSTTAGDKVADGGPYAKTLAAELEKGGDIGLIMGRVNNKMWDFFLKGNRSTYADTVPGSGFVASKSTQLRSSNSSTKSSPVTTLIDSSFDVHKETQEDILRHRIRLDFLWCEGNNAAKHFELAKKFAEQINLKREDFGVGRIRVKPLSIDNNRKQGYRVHQNIMRYDAFYANKVPIPVSKNSERQTLMKIAAFFPDAGFLPKPGIGVNGKPTGNYISAFVCLED